MSSFLFVFFQAMFSRAVIPFDPFRDDRFVENTKTEKKFTIYDDIFSSFSLAHYPHKRQPQVGVINGMEIYSEIQ